MEPVMHPIPVATANVNKRLRGPRLRRAIAAATAGRDLVLGQEAESDAHVHDFAGVHGLSAYFPDGAARGRTVANACPILYSADRFRRLDAGSVIVGEGIAHIQPDRVANWVLLEDRASGVKVAAISAHTVSGVWRNLARRFAQWSGRTRRQESDHELEELAALTGRLAKRVGGDGIVIGGADLNRRTKLHPSQLGADRTVYAAHPTHGRHWYDVIWLVGAKASHVRAVASPSDHDVLVATVTPTTHGGDEHPSRPSHKKEKTVARSYNGWPASPSAHSIDIVDLTVHGVQFVGGVRAGDVHTVLGHIADQYHRRVEPLRNPGCWGWAYRQNRNADNLSCHSSGTAIDCNAPRHPNGIEARENYSRRQIDEVHRILREIPELDAVVHWGGDWHRPSLTPDPMHFEIHDHDTAKLRRVADRIRNQSEEDDMSWNEDLAEWEPGDKNPKDQMKAGQQLNQARGYAKAAYDNSRVAIDAIRALGKALGPTVEAAVDDALKDAVVDVDVNVRKGSK